MKKTIVLLMFFCFVASAVFAEKITTVIIKGDIIDNLCASSLKPEKLVEFLKTHTKQCALQPQCVASGFSISSEGKLMKFDKISCMDIEEFLKLPTSKLQVVVECEKTNDLLRLVYIENQK